MIYMQFASLYKLWNYNINISIRSTLNKLFKDLNFYICNFFFVWLSYKFPFSHIESLKDLGKGWIRFNINFHNIWGFVLHFDDCFCFCFSFVPFECVPEKTFKLIQMFKKLKHVPFLIKYIAFKLNSKWFIVIYTFYTIHCTILYKDFIRMFLWKGQSKKGIIFNILIIRDFMKMGFEWIYARRGNQGYPIFDDLNLAMFPENVFY